MKIIVDSSSRMLYASYYIEGLYTVFGKQNVCFSRKPFLELKREREAFAFEHYCAFEMIEPDGKVKKYIIDFCDPPDINQTAYSWCDVYGKINYNSNITGSKFTSKIVSLPPGFGIKIWGFWETLGFAFYNLLKCGLRPIVPYQKFLRDYYLQFRRPKLNEYTLCFRKTTNDNFVFMIATLWKDDEETNRFREMFLENAKFADFTVEGGFFATLDHPKYENYRNWVFTKAYSTKEYLAKTKKSIFVFNTPAVHGCHGWKLGEYMAMGKAIISTPIINELPLKLEHGSNMHFVSCDDELLTAIKLLGNDPSYREMLGTNIKLYYESVASPQRVIQRLLNE